MRTVSFEKDVLACMVSADFSMRGSDAGVIVNDMQIQKGSPAKLPPGSSLSFPPYTSKYRFLQIDGYGV